MDKNVTVIGMGHLGCVTTVCLSKLGFQVTCLDFDNELIERLKKRILPIYEPGLEEIFQNKNTIKFTSSFQSVIPKSDVLYIAYDIPVNENDISDLSIFNKIADTIIPLLSKNTMIVISSQIPVGTSDIFFQKLKAYKKNNPLVYIPENLRLGNAIKLFLEPDRIIVGLSDESVKERIKIFYSKIKTKYFFMSLKSAEMAKHALNSYLGLMISFSSEISDICEKVGANAIEVMKSLKEEKRVSKDAPLSPGLGFGGGTIARDIQVLKSIGNKINIKTPLLDSVLEVNNNRIGHVYKKLLAILGSLEEKKITFFGLTYKTYTNTLKRSLALQLIRLIKKKNTNLLISAYDPMIKEQIKGYEYISVANNMEEAANNSNIILIFLDYDEFKELDYNFLLKNMKTRIILDTKNLFYGLTFKDKNFKYYGIGYD